MIGGGEIHNNHLPTKWIFESKCSPLSISSVKLKCLTAFAKIGTKPIQRAFHTKCKQSDGTFNPSKLARFTPHNFQAFG